MSGPWIDTVEGQMWTPAPGGRPFRPAGPSTRNDALWEAKTLERRAFVALAHRWREAAIADGWNAEPSYGDHEPLERAWRLTRDGYVIQGLSRAGDDKSLPTASVHIWGPDGLAIEPPLEYDLAAIRRGAETCSECGACPVRTERVAFANRVCGECAPAARRALETPGWCD